MICKPDANMTDQQDWQSKFFQSCQVHILTGYGCLLTSYYFKPWNAIKTCKHGSLFFFFQDADDVDYVCTHPEIVRVPDPEILLVFFNFFSLMFFWTLLLNNS